jgi:hypothetical protein
MTKPKCERCGDTGEVEVEPTPYVLALWDRFPDEVKEACRRCFCTCAIGRRRRREHEDRVRRETSNDLH